MFRPTSPQQSLLESRFLVPPEKRARLEGSWAQPFRDVVLPLIDEELFRSSFDAAVGRPNKSVRLLVGLLLLKEWNDLTDEQVVEQFEFNLLWHHALGVDPGDAHVCIRTLYNFRQLLAVNGLSQQVFDDLTRKLAEGDGIRIHQQRLDSTHIMTNIAVLSRLGLFVETITHFLQVLRRASPERLAALGASWSKRYLDREGYFADARGSDGKRRLSAVADDLYRLLQHFSSDAEIVGWEAFKLMQRLFDEQCVVEPRDGGESGGGAPADGDGGAGGPGEAAGEAGPVGLREPKTISGSSLQSPYDPDATYGHKGKGYELQVVETCAAENPYQLIVHTSLNGANESDQHATIPSIAALQKKGLGPDELLADTAYGSGENIVQAAELGVELVAPVQDPDAPRRADRWATPLEPAPESAPDGVAPADRAVQPDAFTSQVTEAPDGDAAVPEAADPAPLDLGTFAFNATFDQVIACPEGNAPLRNEVLDPFAGKPYKATFDGAACAGCPMTDRCPTQAIAGTEDRRLRWRDSGSATSSRQKEQQTPAFKERYKRRSGIEATNAHLKGRPGAGRLRVRGKTRAETALTFKALGLNVRRAIQYRLRPPAPTQNEPVASVSAP